MERPSPDGLVHAGMGSDLMALCGTMFGCAGHDQVRLSYVDSQVTCVKCLQLRCAKLQVKADRLQELELEELRRKTSR